MAIVSDEYRKEYAALLADPIIIEMAAGLTETPMDQMAGEDGSPIWAFMNAAGKTYHERGGTIPTSIGGPATALLTLVRIARGIDEG